MKKIIPLLLCLCLLTSCEFLPYSSADGITGLPTGELLSSYESSTGEHTVNIYLCDGGATVDYAIRGEVVTNETGIRKNIYWNYHESAASVKWIDDETVTINDHTLNIHDEVYDFRWD